MRCLPALGAVSGVCLARLLLACEPMAGPDAEAVDGRALAHMAEAPITPADLPSWALEHGPEATRRALETVVARRLAAAEARRRGLHEEQALAGQIAALRREARAREEALLAQALFEAVRDGVQLSEAELRAHYAKHRVRYTQRQIHLRRQRYATEAAARAAAAAGGAGELAEPLDPTRAEAIGPAPVAELPREILPEALRLRSPGERVVVADGDGWWVVELVEVLPAVPRLFGAVRDEVERSLRTVRAQAAYGELLEGLRARAEVEVEIHETALGSDEP